MKIKDLTIVVKNVTLAPFLISYKPAEEPVLKLYKVLMVVAMMAMLSLVLSCSSEAPETQKLYTDAKQMWDDLNRAFSLPKSQERIDLMNKLLSEAWDVKIVDNLNQYLKAAPTGKFAAEATSLLEQVKNSDRVRMLGQARPMMQMLGDKPKTVQEVDSLTKAHMAKDTTK
jgi:hypothetical protein